MNVWTLLKNSSEPLTPSKANRCPTGSTDRSAFPVPGVHKINARFYDQVEPIYSDHSRIDERSLAMHRLAATKLRANPAILDEARENLRRWQNIDDSPRLALSEWESILRGPVDEVSRFLEERSEKANRLRQSSPFAGVLTDAERRTIYESYSTRTYNPGGQPNLG